jgi:predicted transcriptional regulator YheO
VASVESGRLPAAHALGRICRRRPGLTCLAAQAVGGIRGRVNSCQERRTWITNAETKVVLAKKLHADKSLEIDDICQMLKMSRSTVYRYVRL